MFKYKKFIAVNLSALTLAFLYGCATPKVTNSKRSAVEELVISTAADRSVAQLAKLPMKDKKVFVDFTNLACTDAPYVKGCLRQRVGSYGCFLVDDKKNADYILEVFSGALDTDFESYLLGIPKIGIPVPFSGTFFSPEIALYKRDAQSATGKFGFNVIDTKTRKMVGHQENMIGHAYFNRHNILGISWNSSDIPKKNEFDK